MQTNPMVVDSDCTLAKIGPRYSFATTAEAALIRSGAVTTGQIRMCAQEHSNRRLLAKCTPPLSEHAHCQTMIDSKIVNSKEGEGLQVFDTHLERTYTYEKDGSECKPGGREATHPGPSSEPLDCSFDYLGSDALQPPGGAPMPAIAIGYMNIPPPSGGVPPHYPMNDPEVFVDDGDEEVPPSDNDEDSFADDSDGNNDIVDPVTLAAVVTAQLAIAPSSLSVALTAVAAAQVALPPGSLSLEAAHTIATAAIAAAVATTTPVVIPPDDDSSDASASDTAATNVPTPTVSDFPPAPGWMLVCNTPGCQRRSHSDPSGRTQFELVCCNSCLPSNGQLHTQTCQAVNLTVDQYHAWRMSLAPAPAPPSSGNSGSDGRGSSYHDDDWRPGWHNYGLGDNDDESWIGHQTNNGEDSDSVFNTL